MSKIQYPGPDTTDEEPAEKRNPELATKREAVKLRTETVKGSALQGKARAKLRARLTNMFNEPLVGQDIRFYVESGGQEFGTESTDQDGWAERDTGQHISDVQLMLTAALSGYVAEYGGSRNYRGATAKGSFNATL
ncbi:hypothetical protein [Streptomyces sp. NPDC058612]|uniref:hypothetical protein n=1 Tax=Streptomyces sp. NPDC058612 TaxID=3346555 RepID=UPI00365A2E22